MEALARSQADIERRADAERALRQIAARITALHEPDDILQAIVDEARRLLRADGAGHRSVRRGSRHARLGV